MKFVLSIKLGHKPEFVIKNHWGRRVQSLREYTFSLQTLVYALSKNRTLWFLESWKFCLLELRTPSINNYVKHGRPGIV